jgi:DNA modification methylase
MNEIVIADAWEYMKECEDNRFDVIITDPLYDAELNMDELRRVCKGHIIAFCAPENEFFVPDERAYWIKTPSTKNYSRHLGRFVEHILIERRGDTFNANLHWSNYTGVYTDVIQSKNGHPFQKPISLLERLVLIYSNPGDLIFDPFAGSGTTIKAAVNCGRRAIGCEIAPEFRTATKPVEAE